MHQPVVNVVANGPVGRVCPELDERMRVRAFGSGPVVSRQEQGSPSSAMLQRRQIQVDTEIRWIGVARLESLLPDGGLARTRAIRYGGQIDSRT